MSRIILFLLTAAALTAQPYTRGVGVYPGDPREDFAPSLAVDNTSYRNLALHRPAYHSSAYDYNLTAQLVTDGIKETTLPRWLSTSTSAGPLKKNERELVLDHNTVSTVNLTGSPARIQFEFAGGDAPFEIDRVDIYTRVMPNASQPAGWTAVVSGSDDGQSWRELGRVAGNDRPAREFKPSVAFAAAARERFYRVEFQAPSVTAWRVGEVMFFDRNQRVEVAGPHHFTSAWMPAGKAEEWVYVDLGASCTFDRVALSWIRRAAEGAIQVSDDAAAWRTIQPLGAGDDYKLAQPANARYVRLLLTRPATPEGYILSEFEVFGRGGPVQAKLSAGGGNPNFSDPDLGRRALWRIQRDSLVTAGGPALSQPGFKDADWLLATVPATVLSSYLNAGAIPDPNYGDNQLMISDSFFHADFWYRTEFLAPALPRGRRLWLAFNGINWKADVFLNGEKIGRIEGGFMRGRFDITGKIHPGAANALAVRVEKNATPGSVKEKTFDSPGLNGGALGADNPTYHAAIGWDWIPTVRGRDSGIWSDVTLSSTGPVTIENPFVRNTSLSDVTVEATLHNNETTPVTGMLRGRFGDQPFQVQVTLAPGEEKTVTEDVRLTNPRLWWPAGYGDPNLYTVYLEFLFGSGISDTKTFQSAIRQFTYSEEGGALKIWINGKRFIARGGNWGFPESMLRYRAREYDVAVRYHKEMNFTMIRDWVGQIGDDAFYEACDRWGIVVWQDFWLANPVDGPDPDDNGLFLRNAKDYILRIRSHPSVGLYCGRNEGYPPKPIDEGLRKLIAELHPGLHYISSSADDVVSGHGPYRAMPEKFYYQQRATPKLHSELGMPNIVTLDSLKLMMPTSAQWPQGAVWGIHDFSLNGAQGGSSFRDMIDKSYGGAATAAGWVNLAQFINYTGYRAMFEAQGKNRMGLLIWMSHPCWPSFVWQTYDYYFDPTAAYFGAKKASEPLHIQWNPATDMVEVVNYSGREARALTAQVEILNLDGSVKWRKTADLDSPEDSDVTPIKMEYPAGLSGVHFIRLKLTRGSDAISENFYWRGVEEGNYLALRDLPKVKLEAATRVDRRGGQWVLTTELRNPSPAPVLMVHLKVVRETSGDRILPAIYSDNYIALMPGERRTIRTEVSHADTRGEKPAIVVE
ncbi:MAG TPA: discoidin domain-containing protein [Bryobacteraceae bacterium]|nr:discoidin domain-containing protein [Bryobacteraceae bacterium]